MSVLSIDSIQCSDKVKTLIKTVKNTYNKYFDILTYYKLDIVEEYNMHYNMTELVINWCLADNNQQCYKIIEDVKVNIIVNNVKVNEVSCEKSEKTLGVHLSPSMKWEGQFNAMVKKMKEAICKLRKVEIAAPIACMHYNAHLIKKVYFVL